MFQLIKKNYIDLLSNHYNLFQSTKEWKSYYMYHYKKIYIALSDFTNPNIKYGIYKNNILYKQSSYGNYNFVKLLLRYGFYPNNISNVCYNMPLHVACAELNTKCIKLLLKWGADPNITNGFNQNALHFAIIDSYDGYFDIIIILLKYNINIHHKTFDGCTPYDYALHKNKTMFIELLKLHL